MNQRAIALWGKNEYDYPMAYGFMPNIVPYLHEDTKTRPCILVVPGGGYCFVSPSEGEPVADRFWDKGYQTFVLTYTVNMLFNSPLQDQALKDISRAIRMIRKNADRWHIDPKRIYICGFSAGGHLCADSCVHFMETEDPDPQYRNVSARPDAAILSYPVITSGEYAHQDSFRALLGSDIYEEHDEHSRKALEHASLETQVSRQTPPCFLWHTATDGLVPMENTLLFVHALKEHGVPCAMHIFSKGNHGLSIADSSWAHGRVGDNYCMEQSILIAEAVRQDRIMLPLESKKAFLESFHEVPTQEELQMNIPNPEVAVWPELADQWLESIGEQRT